MATEKPHRTLAELLDALPERVPAKAIPRADLPEDFAPTLKIPRSDHMGGMILAGLLMAFLVVFSLVGMRKDRLTPYDPHP